MRSLPAEMEHLFRNQPKARPRALSWMKISSGLTWVAFAGPRIPSKIHHLIFLETSTSALPYPSPRLLQMNDCSRQAGGSHAALDRELGEIRWICRAVFLRRPLSLAEQLKLQTATNFVSFSKPLKTFHLAFLDATITIWTGTGRIHASAKTSAKCLEALQRLCAFLNIGWNPHVSSSITEISCLIRYRVPRMPSSREVRQLFPNARVNRLRRAFRGKISWRQATSYIELHPSGKIVIRADSCASAHATLGYVLRTMNMHGDVAV